MSREGQARPDLVVLRNGDDESCTAGMLEEYARSVLNDGLSSELKILLGQSFAHACTATRRGNHDPEANGRLRDSHVRPGLQVQKRYRASS